MKLAPPIIGMAGMLAMLAGGVTGSGLVLFVGFTALCAALLSALYYVADLFSE